MSAVTAEAEAESGGIVCANCGVAEGDEIKLLEECTACQSVRYCGDKCREEHQELHSEECENRKALLHDKKLLTDRKLFTQPEETHYGECPICFLPLPLDPQKTTFKTCCSQIVCNGCTYANIKSGGGDRCSFCRESVSSGDEEARKRLMKRMKAEDPAALCYEGEKCHKEGDYDGAFEYFTKSAELGDMDAHYRLGLTYMLEQGVEKDEEKAVYHWEMAAIGGHPAARHNLAIYEKRNGNVERSVKHLVIAANHGSEPSMKVLWKHYSAGNITKEDLEVTLRTHKAALDEMKSEQRDFADAFIELKENEMRQKQLQFEADLL